MSRVVTGTLLLPNGQPMANALIYFTAKRNESVSIVEGSNAFFLTNAAGVYSQSIVNGFYAVSIEYTVDSLGAGAGRKPLGNVLIENGPNTTLESLLIASNPVGDPALSLFYEILLQAQQAATNAQNSASAAAASAASISVGSGPTQLPNNTILNARLGTSGNLGSMAQQNANAVAITGGSVADAALPVNQVGKNFSSTVAVSTTSNNPLVLNSTASTGEIQHKLNSVASGYTKWDANSLFFLSKNAAKSFGIDNTSGFSDGMRFGNVAISNANILDWYEEGGFTPTVQGSASVGSATYQLRLGKFQRVGNRVNFQINIVYTDHTGSGNLIISGLPYVSSGSASNSIPTVYRAGVSVASGNALQAFISPASSLVYFDQVNPAGNTFSLSIVSAGNLLIFGSYEV